MPCPSLNVSVEIDLVITGKCDISLLEVIHAAAEHTRLAVAGFSLTVIVDSVDVLYSDVVELLDGSLYLKLVGFPVNDEAVTVVLFSLSRHLLGDDWLDNDTHLFALLTVSPFREDILHTVHQDHRIGVHDGVGVDFVDSDDLNLREVT